MRRLSVVFVHVTATTEIYTLSLHDALPISVTYKTVILYILLALGVIFGGIYIAKPGLYSAVINKIDKSVGDPDPDRKSTRLNSSHTVISYAVFCLKKKKTQYTSTPSRPPHL